MKQRCPNRPSAISSVFAPVTLLLGWCVCHADADDGVPLQPVTPHVDRNTPFFNNNCGLVEVSASEPWEFAVCYSAHIRSGTGPCVFSCNSAATCGISPDTGHGVICWPPHAPPQGQSGALTWYNFVTYLNQSCSTTYGTIPVKYYRRTDPTSVGYAFNLSNLTGWNYANGLYIRPGIPFVLYDGGPQLDHVASGPNGGNFVSAYFQLYAGFGQCTPGLIEPGTVFVGNQNEREGHVAMIGTQSLAIGVNPSILGVNTNSAWRQNAVTHHTTHYYSPEALTGVPSIGLTQILRRGERATFEVEVSSSFSTACHDIAMKLWDSQSPGGEWIRVPPRNNPASSNSWGVEILDVRDNQSGTRQIVTVEVSIPVTSPVGRYDAYFTIEYSQSEVEIVQYQVDGPDDGQLILLCNPWNTQDSTSFSEVSDERHIRRAVDIVYWENNLNVAHKWNVYPGNSLILDETLRFLVGAPASIRSAPELTARWLSQKVNGRNNPTGMLRGMWAAMTDNGLRFVGNQSPNLPPNPHCEASPVPSREEIDVMEGLTGSVPVFNTWRRNRRAGPILHAQCWVYAGVMCSSLRTLGIPARIVSGNNIVSDAGSYTGLANANDISDGKVIYCYQVPANSNQPVLNACRMNDYSWRFHIWNELCTRRAGISVSDWQALDATPAHALRLSRSANARSSGPALLQDVRAGAFSNSFDVLTFYSYVNSGSESVLKRTNGTDRRNWPGQEPLLAFPRPTKIVTYGRALGQATSLLLPVSLLSSYQSTVAPPPPPPVTLPTVPWLSVPTSYAIGEGVTATIRFENTSHVERTYEYTVYASTCTSHEGLAVATVGELWGQVVVAAQSVVEIPFILSWENISAENEFHPLLFLGSYAFGPGEEECSAAQLYVDLELPTLTLTSGAQQSHPNGVVGYSLQFDEPLAVPLHNVRIQFIASGELGYFAPSDFEQVLLLGNLPAGAVIAGSAIYRARIPGEESIIAFVWADEFVGPFPTGDSVFISGCSGDFDDSGDVSIQDLFTFLSIWFVESAQPCAWGLTSDVNGDGCASIQDLFDFIGSYFAGC